ncbi:MAG TPA: S8 family serine peptidase, partial [Planctomycetota bacterium]|nr:S8 family serine peptidase [Planctomycetota bacterium]
MFRTPTPDDLAPFALALLFSAQPLLSQPPREEPARYFYFKESRELVRDLARVAVFDESAGALDARLAVLGVDASAVHAWPIRGWALVDVPAERRTTDGVGAWIADLASSGAIAFASPMFVGLDGGPLFPTRDLVVGFEAGVDAASAEAAISAAAPGMRLDRDWTGMPGVYRWRSSFRSGVDVLAAANALALLPSVTFAAPDMVFTGHGGHIPNDAGFVNCWPLHNVGQLGGVADNDMDGPEAWEITAGSPSVKIVILDSGIQQDHPDIHQVPGTDSTSDNASGTFTGGPVNVFDNHGTAVAGCATAVMDNGIGAVGIAPGCVSVSARTFITLNFAGSWTSQ